MADQANDRLPHALLRADNDQEETWIENKLLQLLSDPNTCPVIAEEIDTAITNAAWVKSENLKTREDPRNLTEDEVRQGIPSIRAIAPNPAGSIETMFAALAKLFTAIPPGEQDVLVQFVQDLKDLPRHEVPNGIYPDEDELIGTIELWPISGNWGDAEGEFHRRWEEYAVSGSGLTTTSHESVWRWRNLQAGMARLTAQELIDCSDMTALAFINPSHFKYPDEKRGLRQMDYRYIASHIRAAAQWIMLEGEWVYEACQQEEHTAEVWSMENWTTWLEQFDLFSGDVFWARCQNVELASDVKMEAGRACERMKTLQTAS